MQTTDEGSIPPPKFGLANRGPANRPLGKPSAAPMVAEAPSGDAATTSGLGVVERAELEELRAEAERLRKQNEDIRSERTKLTSTIHELQNQNAQLIEDHTRDVLSIKAKETQLVRARSDAEAAGQMVQTQQREIDRLKRELSQQVRVRSPAPVDISDQIFAEGSNHVNGAYPSTYGRSRAYASTSSSSEGKENAMFDVPSRKLNAAPRDAGRKPGVEQGERTSNAMAATASTDSIGSGSDTLGASDSGTESWKRAAEVTQNLKARIEQMKVWHCTNFLFSSILFAKN